MTTHHFQKIFLAGSVLAIALVLSGWMIAPQESIVGVLAASLVLVVYGVVIWSISQKLEKIAPSLLSTAKLFGLIAGLIFASEIILEYILLPKDNSMMGYMEFGGVFFLYFLSSLVTAYRAGSIRKGIISAVVIAIIATLIWTIVTLSVFYLFRGSSQQELIFQAEGNYADFKQSGMSDFNTFIVEDFMGAVFFHSLLGPIAAVILGFLGGVLGKVATISRRSGNDPAL